MKFIKPKFEDLTNAYATPVLLGERCARVCYKSENLIKEGSARKLLDGIASSGHGAMLEHISVYLKFFNPFTDPNCDEFDEELAAIVYSPYSKIVCDHDIVYVSTNLRVVYEASRSMYDDYMDHDGQQFFYKEKRGVLNASYDYDPVHFIRRITILFDMDRIGSQSFCRHRVFGFAQESTRWCNYMKEKFGSEISISYPCWLKDEDEDEFINDMTTIERIYFKWIKKGYTGQQARYFLPFGLHTQIIMTGFPDAWEHFFSLRNESHAHEQAIELARPLEKYFKKQHYI